jgi:UDP-GlcNAc3NAcA epimerase
MKILTVVGARPQFIKASAISRLINEEFSSQIQEVMVHTGQHYDSNMSQVFFEEFQMNVPKYYLNISGLNHAAMTGRMMEGLEELMLAEKPDLLLVYGDTNSTLAGALTAAKLHIPIAHVEAGLRSFNRQMPEEINRVVTDTLSKYLFCPTHISVQHLKNEGMTQNVHHVGDVMYDVALYYGDLARKNSRILEDLQLNPKDYVLVTCHREENTNNQKRLFEIVTAIAEIAKEKTVVFPLHPRTKKYLKLFHLMDGLKQVKITPPLAYLDLIALEQSASCILTDSGGVQKEAYFYQVPCITMRDETEWVETLELKWNQLVGSSSTKILSAFKDTHSGIEGQFPYGNGQASRKILELLKDL